ncbi:MAG: NAD(P)-dependent oxidoreductase [Candidatus Scalindua sp.]|jgi:dTDP-4-dehydrorhamnose reductase|nr:NAD(P)-dependent oxidoreductase [Candidatus Scalindua sp.]
MNKKVLLLGSTGKLGVALNEVFKKDFSVVGKNSKDFDAVDFDAVRRMVIKESPDILINTVAFLGIDPCEKEPEKAFKLNTLYPKLLGELSAELGFILIHFSTDAVFNDEKKDFYMEKDSPRPLNVYGFTKYGGDRFIQILAKRYYLLRVSVLFGETIKNTQFVEKMLQRVNEGQKALKISSDIIGSPTYSKDIARETKRITENSLPYGLYHLANAGKASLYDLMSEIVKNLKLDVRVEKAYYKDFTYTGIKNTYTPISSEKIDSLRPWKEAVKEYCNCIKK